MATIQAVQTQLIINAPAPVTVSAPDTTAIVASYQSDILPMAKFTVTDAASYVDATAAWKKAKEWIATVESAFKDAKAYAHKAHKAITTLESQLLAPGQQIAAHMQSEILRYQQEQDRIRRAEEQRIQQEQIRIERERREAEAKAAEEERQRRLAEVSESDLAPWEEEDALATIEQANAAAQAMAAAPVAVEPVRLASTIPTVIGGPSVAMKPWAAELFDFRALVRAAATDDNLLPFLSLNQTAANVKARELGADLEKFMPGVRGVRGQTLKG